MKTLLILFALVLPSYSAYAKSSAEAVKEAAKVAGSSISTKHEYEGGYKFEELKRKPTLKLNFLKFLARVEKKAEARFVKFVEANPEEFGDDAAEAKADPKKYLRVAYLMEIQTSYKIFRNGEHIGYAFECADHVDAAQIQDGSWVIYYLDLDMNMIAAEAGQA